MPNLQMKNKKYWKKFKTQLSKFALFYFEEGNPHEWETRIDYDKTKQVYQVYATMDRGSFNRKVEFTKFEDAKDKFLEKLDLTVKINRRNIEKEGSQNTTLHFGLITNQLKCLQQLLTIATLKMEI